jgi:16S rRNA (guanine1207-N2)-methyltransferase
VTAHEDRYLQDAAHSAADHECLRELAVSVRGEEIVVFGKPGVWSWEGPNPGTLALLELPFFEPDARVLDLGCGTGIIGALAARLSPRGRTVLVDCNVAAVACAARTLKVSGVENAEVQLSDGVEELDGRSFDLVLSHLPRGREVQRELIRGAAHVLRSLGQFYFVASARSGIKGAVAYVRDLFGRCGVVHRKKGYHVAMTVRPAAMKSPGPQDSYVCRPITLDGVETAVVSKPGVFAWDRLDAGTACLIDAMEIGRLDRVLDLGCGTGLAGLVAARRAPEGQVILVDADIRAVRSARRTLEANGIENARALLSDGSSVLNGCEPFDVVIANPPFHQGREVDYQIGHQFIQDSRGVLRPGGRLYLVANRFIGYEGLIRQAYGSVATAYAGSSYKVLTAEANVQDP